MQRPPLVRPLFDGPIDIVGDVHGEIDALRGLLRRLGYSDQGDHPEGRRLVFLGDLSDRGPDSPAVVALVRGLVESGRGQCVLGNHDLNILLGHEKLDNWWFFGDETRAEGSPHPQVVADGATREKVTDFFRSLPLALERADVRVVHACWRGEMIDLARRATDAVDLFHHHARLIDEDHKSRPDLDKIDRDLGHQNRNPVKVLTSGPERRIGTPFRATGKLRHAERVRWWEGYEDEPWCVFGHYGLEFGEPNGHGRAIYIDYAVGKRWVERLKSGFGGSFQARLSALRLPEKVVVLDGGEIFPVASQLHSSGDPRPSAANATG